MIIYFFDVYLYMIRDLIFLMYVLSIGVISLFLYKTNDLNSKNAIFMLFTILIIQVVLALPEILFKDSKLANFLTKKII